MSIDITTGWDLIQLVKRRCDAAAATSLAHQFVAWQMANDPDICRNGWIQQALINGVRPMNEQGMTNWLKKFIEEVRQEWLYVEATSRGAMMFLQDIPPSMNEQIDRDINARFKALFETYFGGIIINP
jgi:hypothetical protein